MALRALNVLRQRYPQVRCTIVTEQDPSRLIDRCRFAIVYEASASGESGELAYARQRAERGLLRIVAVG